uniref:nucleoside-diphosphate kinase n=1 Tax=Sus scrofa TaxID=9823 RepID=A0A8D1KJ69_PIG
MICLVLTIFANLFPAAYTGVHERTFLAVKPDGVQRRLVGEIVRRFERKGFKLVALKLVQASEELLREHYAELRERPFYGRLVKYMGSGPVVAMERDSRQRLGGERPPRDSALVPCGRAPVLGRQRRALAVRVATAPRLDRVVAASAFSGPHPGSSEPPSCSRDHSSPQHDSRAGRCTLPGMAGDRLPAPDEALGPGSSLRPSLWQAWEASGVLLWSLALPSISFYNKLTETCAQVSWAQVHRHTMLRHLLHTEQIRRFSCRAKA